MSLQINNIHAQPRFGAKLLQEVPLSYHGKVPGTVPAQVWLLESQDLPRFVKIIDKWKDVKGFSLSKLTVGVLKLKIFLDKPFFRAIRHGVLKAIYGAINFCDRLIHRVLGKAPPAPLTLEANKPHKSLMVMTVGGQLEDGLMKGGKTVGYMSVNNVLGRTMINYVETAPWNRALEKGTAPETSPSAESADKPRKGARYLGVMEGLLYSALKLNPDKRLTWIPAHTAKRNKGKPAENSARTKPRKRDDGEKLKNHYEFLIRHKLKTAPLPSWLGYYLPVEQVKKLIDLYEAEAQKRKPDPAAVENAQQAMQDIPEPVALIA